jgi:phosphoserine phosphatase
VVVAAFRPTAEIVATEVRFRDDRADTMGPHLVGPRKVEALRSMGVERLDEAWTDSAHDLPLLSLAERRFRVDRDGTIHELRELAPG